MLTPRLHQDLPCGSRGGLLPRAPDFFRRDTPHSFFSRYAALLPSPVSDKRYAAFLGVRQNQEGVIVVLETRTTHRNATHVHNLFVGFWCCVDIRAHRNATQRDGRNFCLVVLDTKTAHTNDIAYSSSRISIVLRRLESWRRLTSERRLQPILTLLRAILQIVCRVFIRWF